MSSREGWLVGLLALALALAATGSILWPLAEFFARATAALSL